MTFDDLKATVKGYVNLTSTDADTRVGQSINRHYRRITASLGMDATRFVTRTVTTTVGVQAVTFEEIEKIDRILNTTDSSAILLMQEIELHQMRSKQPGTDAPNQWALRDSGASTVTVLLDTIPQSAYTLQADGRAALADLQGDDSPAFPESFHDILPWFVIAEELLKKEKAQLAAAYEAKAERLLSDLRFHLADSPTRETKQRSSESVSGSGSSSGGGSGGGALGSTAYTQTALVTFDLGAGVAPFAVASTSAPVVANLDSDKLDGEDGTFYLDRANHSGTVTITPSDITSVTTNRILGRDTPSDGVCEELTVGGGVELNGAGVIQTSAFTGDVTKTAGGTALTIAADAVSDTKLRDSSACSVIGRSANSIGNPADIAASTNHTILARLADVLTWVAGFAFDGAGRIMQIAFAASHNPSTDANTLDDYEEGTWTPADGSGAGLTFTSVEAYYVKIGQLVTATARFTYPATADATTNNISGLPFTVQDTTANVWMAPVVNTSGTPMALEGINNTTTATFINYNSSAGFTNANMSGLTVRFTFSFRATA
jgi:hypothetical protein